MLREDASAAALLDDQTKSAAQDASEIEIERTHERANCFVLAIDELAAHFDMKWCERRLAECPHSTAEAIARFEHADGCTAMGEGARGDETRQTRPGDHDAHTAKRAVSLSSH